MSGTSMDAIDAALVRFADRARLECYREYPLGSSLRRALRGLSEHSPLGAVSRLDERLGFLFAEAVKQLLRETGLASRDIVAIGSHGQTILHRPAGPYPASIQIGDPNVICNATGITTVADFRRMDMVNGGQGAPLAGATAGAPASVSPAPSLTPIAGSHSSNLARIFSSFNGLGK